MIEVTEEMIMAGAQKLSDCSLMDTTKFAIIKYWSSEIIKAAIEAAPKTNTPPGAAEIEPRPQDGRRESNQIAELRQQVETLTRLSIEQNARLTILEGGEDSPYEQLAQQVQALKTDIEGHIGWHMRQVDAPTPTQPALTQPYTAGRIRQLMRHGVGQKNPEWGAWMVHAVTGHSDEDLVSVRLDSQDEVDRFHQVEATTFGATAPPQPDPVMERAKARFARQIAKTPPQPADDPIQMMQDALKDVFTPESADELWEEMGCEPPTEQGLVPVIDPEDEAQVRVVVDCFYACSNDPEEKMAKRILTALAGYLNGSHNG